MSAKNYQIQELGYDSWLSLYEELVSGGLHLIERIELSWPEAPPPAFTDTIAPKVGRRLDRVVISIQHIQAKAFDEIYGNLPLKQAVNVVMDLV